MTHVIWDTEWDTGIVVLDKQHREMFKLFQKITDSVMDGSINSEQALLALREFVDHHFVTEEHAMRLADYPGMAAHKSIHDELRVRLEAFTDRDVQEGCVGYVFDWFVRHIDSSDKEMAVYLRRNWQSRTINTL